MKFAHVATKWIGKGLVDDKWRADMPAGYCRMTVLLEQYVNRAIDCPSPNVVVVRIQESRKKHEGYIEHLKSNLNQIVLETWEDDWPVVLAATTLRLKNFLVRQGVDEAQAEYIVNAKDRTATLLEELDLADKRCRRQMELDRRA